MAQHKDPTARKHLWERPGRPDEAAVAEAPPNEYKKLSLPRYMHDDELAMLLVSTPEEAAAAEKDGWSLEPIPQTLYHAKSGEPHQVSSVEQRAHALAQGYALEPPSGDTLKDHDSRIEALAAEIERLKAASASAKAKEEKK